MALNAVFSLLVYINGATHYWQLTCLYQLTLFVIMQLFGLVVNQLLTFLLSACMLMLLGVSLFCRSALTTIMDSLIWPGCMHGDMDRSRSDGIRRPENSSTLEEKILWGVYYGLGCDSRGLQMNVFSCCQPVNIPLQTASSQLVWFLRQVGRCMNCVYTTTLHPRFIYFVP